MAGLLYFRPGLAKPTKDDLVELQLEHAFSRPPACRDCIGKGPSGAPGIVFADPNRMGDCSIGYYEQDQDWKPIPVAEGEPKIWIGWYKNHKPTPADLSRGDQLDGHRVRLGDGGEWLVPLLHEWTDDGTSCVLPRPVTRRGDGNWVYGDVIPIYRALWEAGCRYWQTLIAAVSGADDGEGRVAYEFPGLFDFACELLAVNYVVGWQEVSALELFLPDIGSRIAEASVDWPTFRDWFQKKTASASAGGDSSLGREGSTETTDQPAPTTTPSHADGT